MALPRPTRPPVHREETVAQPQHIPMEPLDPVDFRPSDVFHFDPKPDITMEELAQVFAMFFAYIDLNADRFLGLDQDLQRHFDLVQKP